MDGNLRKLILSHHRGGWRESWDTSVRLIWHTGWKFVVKPQAVHSMCHREVTARHCPLLPDWPPCSFNAAAAASAAAVIALNQQRLSGCCRKKNTFLEIPLVPPLRMLCQDCQRCCTFESGNPQKTTRRSKPRAPAAWWCHIIPRIYISVSKTFQVTCKGFDLDKN